MSTRADKLAASHDMAPVQGTVDLSIPVDVLWTFFSQANLWPRWNKCFTWVHNRDLILGQQLIWSFEPIRKWYLYKMPAKAKIVEAEPHRKVTWEVTAFPGMYARHTYHMEDLGNGRTRFGSWEQGMGPGFNLTRWLWIPHFTFVKDRSLDGVRYLEKIYSREGRLDADVVPSTSSRAGTYLALAIPGLIGAAVVRRYYDTYMAQKIEHLAPGVYAVLNGGGNSLVIDGGSEVLLVDPKFPPFSHRLRGWIARNIDAPVTQVVNTHYHYDHSQGNALYPQAMIHSQSNVPDLLLSSDNEFSDPDWWSSHRLAIPGDRVNGKRRLTVGTQRVELQSVGPAHTHGDLIVYLPEHEIVATGDIGWNGFRPFIDASEGGASPRNWIATLRRLVEKYPRATFVPGHGPLARSRDLNRFADYMEALYQAVENAIETGLSENDIVRNIDLSVWQLKPMPSFFRGTLQWATLEKNVRAVYRILTRK